MNNLEQFIQKLKDVKPEHNAVSIGGKLYMKSDLFPILLRLLEMLIIQRNGYILGNAADQARSDKLARELAEEWIEEANKELEEIING